MENRDSPTVQTEMLNALTIDVEDYFQVSAFDADIRRDQWDCFPSRVEANTNRVLRLLAQHGLRATFFVLGWVADRFPHLVTAIHRAGHEIGSHGYWHRLVYQQSPDEFRHDVRRSRQILQDIIATPVSAYRAPSFSITDRSLWALDILVEEGYSVDSSIFPVHHDRYGIPGAATTIRTLRTASGPLCEAPPSVTPVAGFNIPVGGGYFRLYPYCLTRAILRRINQQGTPSIFYLHPWEFDPEQPRLHAGTRASRWRHTVNLRRTGTRFSSLLSAFAFGRLDEVIARSESHRHPDLVAEPRRTNPCDPDCTGQPGSASIGSLRSQEN